MPRSQPGGCARGRPGAGCGKAGRGQSPDAAEGDAMTPPLSVVVASVNGLPYLDECLEALAENAPEAEVIVADSTDEATRAHVRERWPAVKLITFDEQMTVPELRAAGVFASTAPDVALIEDHCLVRNGWAQRIVADHERGW